MSLKNETILKTALLSAFIICGIFLPHLNAQPVSMHSWTVEDIAAVPIRQRGETMRFLNELDRTINLYTGEESTQNSPIKMKIVFDSPSSAKTDPNDKKTIYRYFIRSVPDDWSSDYQTAIKLTEASIFCRMGVNPDEMTAGFPHWISTGIAKRAIRQYARVSIPGLSTYPCYRTIISGEAPKDIIWKVLRTPISPEDSRVFQFYAESAEILAEITRKLGVAAKEKYINQMIFLCIKQGALPEDSFKMTAGTFICRNTPALKTPGRRIYSDLELIENFFYNESRSMAINFTMPADSILAEKLFNNAMLLSKEIPNTPDPDISTLSEDNSISGAAKIALIDASIEKLLILKNELPPALQDPVMKIENAIKKLKDGKKDNFISEVSEARDNFKILLKKQQEIESCLASVESQKLTPALKYRSMLILTGESQKQINAPYTELDEYLNKFEGLKK